MPESNDIISINPPTETTPNPNFNHIHPLDRDEVKAIITTLYPKLEINPKKITKQSISSNPDKLELWESKQIQERRKKLIYEPDSKYLARLLYEEFFSVNQNPQSMSEEHEMDSSRGMTPGGMITHLHHRMTLSGQNIEQIASLPSSGNRLEQIYSSLLDTDGGKKAAESMLWYVTSNSFNDSLAHLQFQALRKIYYKNPNYDNYPSFINSLGVRYFCLLRDEPSFMQEIQDENLLEIFDLKKGISKKDALYLIWHQASRAMLDEDHGYFKDPTNNNGAKQMLEKLLIARQHPEMQVFFKFYSPSGYINK